jgi:hypothetical protein
MTFVTKHAIPRRTVLRGVGATLALPLLDAMVPAFAAQPASRSVRRLGVVSGLRTKRNGDAPLDSDCDGR